MTSPTSPAQSIDELVLPLVAAAGLDLWDVEINPRMVRILVDRPGGIDLETVAGVARAISAALDERDDLAPSHNYQLEVGSPGVERTLRTVAHYQRFIGATIAVKTAVAVDGARRLQGVLLASDDTGITVGADQGPVTLTYQQIQKAHTVLIWGPAAKSSAAAPRARASAKAPRGAGPAPSGDRPERMKDVAR
ncbi:MAG TPA: ribosome maturation factor RimP [Acidimicrobiales bacterium]|jgi:ribosome maturation factor RimP|nr:ribosome maturation factor RimP [Acidimicrobiales bacterium]